MENGVIVIYKNKNMVRIIESAKERTERHKAIAEQKRLHKLQLLRPTIAISVGEREKPYYDIPAKGYSDLKTWKRNKTATRQWMRHWHRIKETPSIRKLADKVLRSETWPDPFCLEECLDALID
ncbi:MAG: hypothetical protein DRP97_05185 [Candidatus Latescibacterota bacterium]|nr:MAG: hypothetical protein DRP97_05185 [Candidatus Latescibacterota bacterium]